MADFTHTIDNVIEEDPEFRTSVSSFENGAEQRRGHWTSPIRKWRLQLNNRTQAQMEAIRDFFIAKKGALTSFTWVNPIDSVEYTVRFSEDKLSIKRKSFEIYDIEVSFTQVV